MHFKLKKFTTHALLGLALSSSLAVADWGGKGSFSPLAMTSDNGNPLKLTWTYVVNQGKPMYINENIGGIAVNLTMAFSDLTVSIDPKIHKRESNVWVNVSGSGTGQLRLKVVEGLQAYEEGKTLISSQKVALSGSLTVQGVNVDIGANMLALLSPSSEWFLDRNDLDLLPIGLLYDELEVSADISGKACASAYGQRQCVPLNNSQVLSPESWEVGAHSDTLKVRNSTYSNIVEVRRHTLVPALEGLLGNGGVNTEASYSQYWVAKGIGMVKGIGQYEFMGRPLLVELKDTSITVPKISKLKAVNASAGRTLQISGTGFGKVLGKVMVDGNEINVLSWKNGSISTVYPVLQNPGSHRITIKRDNEIESAPKTLSVSY